MYFSHPIIIVQKRKCQKTEKQCHINEHVSTDFFLKKPNPEELLCKGHLLSQGPQSLGHSPPPALKPFGTGPRRWQVHIATCRAAGEHVHMCSICPNSRRSYLLSPCWSIKLKRLEKSVLSGVLQEHRRVNDPTFIYPFLHKIEALQ